MFMRAFLTTICPYWDRPEALKTYLKALAGASIPEVKHLILFVNGGSKHVELPSPQFEFIDIPPNHRGYSIGHYHNMGAEIANTEWMMKSDVDVLPNVRYYKELLPILQDAGPREWFNGGFIYVKREQSSFLLDELEMPITEARYDRLVSSMRELSQHAYWHPAGSQFICRRADYIALGGCHNFRGWGWEDYQQLYMLECHFRGEDPLPGELDLGNVTQRCRNEISRPKALELFEHNKWLCQFHRWHPDTSGPDYKHFKEHNRQVLLDYILKKRSECPTKMMFIS